MARNWDPKAEPYRVRWTYSCGHGMINWFDNVKTFATRDEAIGAAMGAPPEKRGLLSITVDKIVGANHWPTARWERIARRSVRRGDAELKYAKKGLPL